MDTAPGCHRAGDRRGGDAEVSTASTLKAVRDLLTGNTALMAKVTGVWTYTPDEQACPYIVIEGFQALPGRLLSWREKAWSADLHIWSSYRGMKEVLEIADLIYHLIPAEWFHEDLLTGRDLSGLYHGVLTLRGYDR